MKKFYISKTFIEAIKKQALESEEEIYGWLIGYELNEIPYVLAIYECVNFEHQSIIRAIPKVQEFQEISSILPQGIGPIGIYHSHPSSEMIFHSHIDDSTLFSLSKQFPRCVSIVTNGDKINYYQMGKNKKTREIKIIFEEPEVPRYFNINFNLKLIIKIDKNLLYDSQEKAKNRIKVIIVNNLRNLLEDLWDSYDFYRDGSLVNKNDLIFDFFSQENNVNIQLKMRAFPENIDSEIIISNKTEVLPKNPLIPFKMHLSIKFPIYIKNLKIRLTELNQQIKTELISNNILPRVYKSYIDVNAHKIRIPNEFYIRFFNFYIILMSFNQITLNESELSYKSYKIVLKIISLLDSFSPIKLQKKILTSINQTLKDLIKFSKKYIWYDEILKRIQNLKKKLKN
ncbi:MAG: hypothetical protein EU547_04330 [Promethearchaeota archaeon]|nr:MAG: hypothetical protein EU547_04330 [Candidatus Lokiarchaeota archaeon]